MKLGDLLAAVEQYYFTLRQLQNRREVYGLPANSNRVLFYDAEGNPYTVDPKVMLQALDEFLIAVEQAAQPVVVVVEDKKEELT